MKFLSAVLLTGLATYSFSEEAQIMESQESVNEVTQESEVEKSQEIVVDTINPEIEMEEPLDGKTLVANEFTSIEVGASVLFFDWEGTAKIKAQYRLGDNLYFNAGYERFAPSFGFGSDYVVNQFSGGAGIIVPMKSVETVHTSYYGGVEFLNVFVKDDQGGSGSLTGFNFSFGGIIADSANPNLILTIDTDITIYDAQVLTSNYDFIFAYKILKDTQLRWTIGTDLGFNSLHTGVSLKRTF